MDQKGENSLICTHFLSKVRRINLTPNFFGGRAAALLAVCILFLFENLTLANDVCTNGVLDVSRLSHAHQVSPCVESYFDPESTSSVSDFLSEGNKKFTPVYSGAVNLGFRNGTHWFRLRLSNSSDVEKTVFLSLGNPLVDFARAYEINSKGEAAITGYSGVTVGANQKQVLDRDVVFSLNIPVHQTKTFLIRSAAIQQSYLPVVRSENGFASHQLRENLVFGLYAGVIGVMAIYNFILFFFVRDRSYLWYVLSIIFFHGFCFAGLMGATNYFFWPESPIWAQRHLPAVAPLGLLFSVLFANSFLLIQNSSRRNLFLIRSLIACITLQCLVSVLIYDVSIVVAGFAVQIAALAVVLSAAVPRALRGDLSAYLFLLAWGFLIIGGLVFSFGQFGLYPHSFFTQNGILFGSAAEVVLLSLALGQKINTLRREKEVAQLKAVESANERALLESELIAANAVQETLLPQYPLGKGLDVATFYQVAERVGGDWYWHTDDLRNDVVYFYVGDVTGHGVPSALLTGVVCGAVASLESEYEDSNHQSSPQQRLIHTASVINNVVRKTGARSDRWVSMCLLSLEKKSGRLTIVNAGHPFPLIWRSTSQRLDSVVASGPLLGHSDAQFTVKEDALETGDFVLIYTDGYLEAKERLKPEKQSSRRRELIQLFKSSESPERLIQKVGQEITDLKNSGLVLSDDVTMVTFRWNGPEDEINPLEVTTTCA